MKNNHPKNDSNVETLFLRKVLIIFLAIVSIVCICFSVLYTLYNIDSLKSLMYVHAGMHIIWLIVFLADEDMPTDPLIKMYLSYILMALYPMACIFWNSGDPVVFFWFPLIIIGAIVFRLHNIELWIFLTLFVVISIFFFSPMFPQENLTSVLIERVTILTVISTLTLAGFFAIVYVKKIGIDEVMHNETTRTATENAENIERDKALYNAIIAYLEENKPFKDPNFNAQELAKALHTNVNYISKAISAGNIGNFNVLLNNFRIDYAKSMLSNGALKKYTIDYIYAEAGYKHRSTFNTAFKSITGMTPSDYVSQQNTNDNSSL